MTHIAIVAQLNGKSVEWMEEASDAQYGATVDTPGSKSAGAAPPPPVAASNLPVLNG